MIGAKTIMTTLLCVLGAVIVWEVGIPNRDTLEFFHGSTDWWQPMLHLQFPNEFPSPLVHHTDSCTWNRSVNYAQSRYFNESADHGSEWVWLMEFDLAEVTGDAHLTVAFAAMDATLEVFVNQEGSTVRRPAVTQASVLPGDTLIREGRHDQYQYFHFTIPGENLLAGENVFAFGASSSNMGAEISLMYDYISLEMQTSDTLQPGHCWDTNPGWGANCFLTASVNTDIPQSCRPNVEYFDRCLADSGPRYGATTASECEKHCAMTPGCAVFATNAREECYLHASADDPRSADASHGFLSCPMQTRDSSDGK